MNALGITRNADRLEHSVVRRLAPHRDTLLRVGIDLLRISLGLVSLLFGALKFVPGLGPAESMVSATISNHPSRIRASSRTPSPTPAPTTTAARCTAG